MNVNSLSENKKKCILRFLYRVANADYKVVREEVQAIADISRELNYETDCTDPWLTAPWSPNDEKVLYDLMESDDILSGRLLGWARAVMNADHIKHQNEQVAIMKLLLNSIGKLEFPKAILVPVNQFDPVMKEMIKKTPEICMRKGDWWQKKKKKDTPLKKVGASLSWSYNGKKKFVTAVNFELSTPGGSRCAEQNAIGMAVALEPRLKFENFSELVVYGGGGLSNPCWPCGVCMENLRKLNSHDQINLYGYPVDYKPEPGQLPEYMYRLAVSDLNQRQCDGN